MTDHPASADQQAHSDAAEASSSEGRADSRRLSVAVIIATTGRPRTSRLTLDRLGRQTLPPDRILVVAVTENDISELDQLSIKVDAHLGPRGLPHQRNFGLDVLGNSCDLVVFFDDDYLAADDYIENMERLFRSNEDLVGATGHVIADGANGPGFTFEEAEALLATHATQAEPGIRSAPRRGLYGCNMSYRVEAIGDMRFDEALPLYGWQEDVDFSYRMGKRGRLLHCDAMAGVHMGEKAGRTSGRRTGYSQIANPLYLLKKKTIPEDLAWRLMYHNVLSNLWRYVFPEPYIDRRGRLWGNAEAMWDVLTGRIHPGRILEFR
jgi:GT2 family glycosyltransferase